MKIGVLGSGQVGGAIAGKLVRLGHEAIIGSRQPDRPELVAFAESIGAERASYAEAAAHGDWIVNALPGEHAVSILSGCRIDRKILVDICNYDHAVDQPIVRSLGETIQAAFPLARLVKTLNCVSAHLMVDPASLDGPHAVFIASNDADAKRQVSDMLRSFGWQSILDLGDLTACRATEQLIPLWMRLEQKFGNPNFNLAVLHHQNAL